MLHTLYRLRMSGNAIKKWINFEITNQIIFYSHPKSRITTNKEPFFALIKEIRFNQDLCVNRSGHSSAIALTFYYIMTLPHTLLLFLINMCTHILTIGILFYNNIAFIINQFYSRAFSFIFHFHMRWCRFPMDLCSRLLPAWFYGKPTKYKRF